MANTCSHCGCDESSDVPGYLETIDDVAAWSCESCTAAHAPKCDACQEPIWPGEQAARAVTIGREGVDGSLWQVHGGCAPSHVLRCAWVAWDAVGGPEEGGWTFEAGALVAAVPVAIVEVSPMAMELRDSTLTPVDALLEQAFVFDGRRRRLSLTFELALPAASYPESTPRYE